MRFLKNNDWYKLISYLLPNMLGPMKKPTISRIMVNIIVTDNTFTISAKAVHINGIYFLPGIYLFIQKIHRKRSSNRGIRPPCSNLVGCVIRTLARVHNINACIMLFIVFFNKYSGVACRTHHYFFPF